MSIYACGILSLITTALIALKLGGGIAWPWWLILAGLWVPSVIVIVVAVGLGVVAVVGRVRRIYAGGKIA